MIQFSLWSLFNAIALGTIFITLFHFGICAREKAIKDAITPYITLLLLIVIRVILALDSDAFRVIGSKRILATFNDLLQITFGRDLSVGKALALLWFVGAIVSIFLWIISVKKDIKKSKYIRECASKLPRRQAYIADRAGLKADSVFLTDKVDEVITFGIKEYSLFLPKTKYSDIDLYNIFVHEAAHIKHKDIRNRMLLHAFCCIFWWNPFFRLFEKDYAVLMEYRCDENAVKSYTLSEKISYVETLKKMTIVKLDYCYRYMEAGFAIASRKSTLVSRADRILDDSKKDLKKTVGIIVLELCLFLLSYSVIFQPHYDPPAIEGEVIVDKTTAYLVREGEGCRIYINGEDWGFVPKEDLKTKPYCRLEIRE
ncbi:BlaR1 peptidase M56 [Butyrivibrio hungatei DSM 14810]|uniref:BlaR1 peptidase M56 n=1 Tax=Butyrivibrio hungatei DSM 14810 TaxID=1121132 RepID=A0A1M7SVQ5_9FIRM|nr:M56 family metallopeptidase [Butyrivibrio hungatei]SHN62542.1 BlaR1 peptidase M56 [Butyrivibrio hungatei DSM 14810]